ncbi:MAG: heme A synthase, partial [Thalassolituus oleivorans]
MVRADPLIPKKACQMRARFRYTLFTIAAAVGLLGWGAFVTSIDAGLAVPDW